MDISHYLARFLLTGAPLFLQSQAARIGSTDDARLGLEAPNSTQSATLSARSTASDVVHDKIFIPTIVTMGVLAVVALVCCYKIAMGSDSDQLPRGTNWAVPSHAAADRVYNSESPKTGNDGNNQNIAALGRRMSKAQRKSPAPFLPGASQPPGAQQVPYATQPTQFGMSILPSPPPGTQSVPGYWAPEGPPISVLSSAQSATEVGSDGASPKTKPYTAVGGYGFSNQNPAPVEFGAQRSQPSTINSQNNPYGGIDPTYDGNQGGTGHQRTAPYYVDYSKGG